MQGTSRSELTAELERTARLCEDTAEVYVDLDGRGAEVGVVSALLLVAAALDTAVRTLRDEDSDRETALMIAATLARDAVDTAERRGLDHELLQCVTALRRVIALCDT
jgi:hypothetical protein